MKKRFRLALMLLAVTMVATLLTGCFKMTMDVKSNGSCETTYEFDMSQLEGMMSADDLKTQIEDSIEESNDNADKEVVKLKSWKENEKEETITAVLVISDLNKLEDGTFFGTAKTLKKDDDAAFDNLMDAKTEKSVKASKVADNLMVVYWPSTGTDEYGVVEITVKVPGTIKYISDGAELENSKTAIFSGQIPMVVYSKSGLPILPIVIVLAVVVIVVVLLGRKKKPASSAAPTPAAAGGMGFDPKTGAPLGPIGAAPTGMNFDPKTGAPLNAPAAPYVQPTAPVTPQAAPFVQPTAPVAPQAAPFVQPATPVAQPAASAGMNFDPQTGAPIAPPPAAPAGMNFDPQTGAPINPPQTPPQS